MTQNAEKKKILVDYRFTLHHGGCLSHSRRVIPNDGMLVSGGILASGTELCRVGNCLNGLD